MSSHWQPRRPTLRVSPRGEMAVWHACKHTYMCICTHWVRLTGVCFSFLPCASPLYQFGGLVFHLTAWLEKSPSSWWSFRYQSGLINVLRLALEAWLMHAWSGCDCAYIVNYSQCRGVVNHSLLLLHFVNSGTLKLPVPNGLINYMLSTLFLITHVLAWESTRLSCSQEHRVIRRYS